jgi:hypothetical protein
VSCTGAPDAHSNYLPHVSFVNISKCLPHLLSPTSDLVLAKELGRYCCRASMATVALTHQSILCTFSLHPLGNCSISHLLGFGTVYCGKNSPTFRRKCLHLQLSDSACCMLLVHCLHNISSTLKMEALKSCETSVKF